MEKNLNITRADYIKIALMILVPLFYVLIYDVMMYLERDDDGPVAMYFSIGVIFSCIVWLFIKDRTLKKRSFIGLSIVYWCAMLFLLFRNFKLRFDDIWYYYDTFGIIVAMLCMLGFFILVYRFGMRKRKQLDLDITALDLAKANTELTLAIIEETIDDELLQLVINSIEEMVSSNGVEELQTLSKPQRIVHAVSNFESEVSSDGFSQYYSNNQHTELLLEALNAIGANRFADLALKAKEIYKNTIDTLAENNPFEKVDDDFFELYGIENLYLLQVDFIRSNKTSFAKK